MGCEDLKKCDASKTILKYEPIDPVASLWDDGDLISFTVDSTDIETHSDHTGNIKVRSGKQERWVDVSVQLLPCTPFYNALYNAWLEDAMICGDLIISEDCCSPKIIEDAEIKEMGIKPVSFSIEAVEVVFRGTLPRGNSVSILFTF